MPQGVVNFVEIQSVKLKLKPTARNVTYALLHCPSSGSGSGGGHTSGTLASKHKHYPNEELLLVERDERCK